MADRQLAEVVTLYDSNYRDVPATLRRIADMIEHGNLAGAKEAALVVMAPAGLEVFGLGDADATGAHYLLCCGAAKLQMPTIRHGDDQ
ncbi:hypothetical protein D3C76_47890 [compost metagenome]